MLPLPLLERIDFMDPLLNALPFEAFDAESTAVDALIKYMSA